MVPSASIVASPMLAGSCTGAGGGVSSIIIISFVDCCGKARASAAASAIDTIKVDLLSQRQSDYRANTYASAGYPAPTKDHR